MPTNAPLLLAIVAVLLVVVAWAARGRGADRFRAWNPILDGDMGVASLGLPSSYEVNPPADGIAWNSDMSQGYPYNFALDTVDGPDAGRRNGASLLSEDLRSARRFYSAAEVDPLVTGQLYAGARGAGEDRRWVYGMRTSHGTSWGMHEAGVDVGLLGMREYSLDGKQDVFDDGIPAEWKMPATPMNWYKPRQRDYYDVEAQGVAPYKPYLLPLFEPDHQPKIN